MVVGGVAWVPGVLSGCGWAGKKKHRMLKRPKRIAVLCVFLLTCVKFDLGCGDGVKFTTLWVSMN